MGLLEISAESDNLHSDHALVTRSSKISKRKEFYLHGTVKDFPKEPKTWAEIQSHTANSMFNPHIALLRSSVMQLKIESMSHGPGNNSLNNVWDLVGAALKFARQAEVETSQSQTALLREVNYTAAYHWKMEITPPSGNWVTRFWKQESPETRCFDEFCQCEVESCSHDFISFSIDYGMPRFALQEIEQDPKGVLVTTGRPWLDYSLSSGLKMTSSFHGPAAPAFFPNLELFSALLSYGSDPNKTFKPSDMTPWQRALQWVDDSILDDFDACTFAIILLTLMHDYGADPTRKSIASPFRRPLSAIALVDKVFTETTTGKARFRFARSRRASQMLAESQFKNKMRKKFAKVLYWNRRNSGTQNIAGH